MHEFILNIDNKEVLIEVPYIHAFVNIPIHSWSTQILHHAVDHLIESPKSRRLTATKFSHKFGFANPDEFETAIRYIADAYRRFVLQQIGATELVVQFAHLNADLQQSVLDVISTRLPEVQEFLLVEHNGRDAALVQSFDWDIKMVMGSSRLASIRQLLITLVLQCRPEGGTGSAKSVFFEMDRTKLRETIAVLENCARQMDEQVAKPN